MIVQNLRPYSHKVKWALILVESILCIIATIMLIICVVGQVLPSDTEKPELKIIIKISSGLWALGIISFIDLLSLFFNKENLSLHIIHLFNKKKFSLPLTAEQEKVVTTYFANENNNILRHLVIVNGKSNVGKSECVDILLEKIFFQSSKNKDMIEGKMTFIDCYNDSKNTTNFINSLKFEELNKEFIIIDNCNEAEYSIVSKLAALNEKHNCSILLIEENCDYFKKHSALEQCEKIDFTSDIPNNKKSLDKFVAKEKMTPLKNQILFTIDYYYRYYNICRLSNIVKALNFKNIEKIKGYLFVRKLIRKGILKYFPLSSNFFRFKNNADSEYIVDEKLYDVELFEKTIIQLNNKETNQEVKWLSLLDLPSYIIIKNYNQTMRYDLFYQALDIGNYNKLLSALANHVKKYSDDNLFNYEFAVLHYNNGNYAEAIEHFKQVDTNSAIYYNGLISTLHGCKDEQVIKEVDEYILKLKNLNPNYGEYWYYHIQSEHGVFNIKNLRKIANNLYVEYKQNNTGLTMILLERCITDELRWMWISQNSDETEYSKRLSSLQTLHSEIFAGKNNVEYYKELYFSAGHIHYYEIPIMMWINNGYHVNQNHTNIQLYSVYQKQFDQAVADYKLAINSPYDKQKSKQAAKVKLADLLSMSYDFDYSLCIKDVAIFKEYAEKQKIDVFIAYANTLLAKLKILQAMKIEDFIVKLDEIKEIDTLITSALNIYTEYQNKYGVQRCKFIKILFNLLQYFSAENNKFDKELRVMKDLSITCNGLELKFIEKLNRFREISYMDVYNSLKYYPIILQ